MKKSTALGTSRSGGTRDPQVFHYTLRVLRSGGTRLSFARDDFFTSSHFYGQPPAPGKPALGGRPPQALSRGDT
ncbi:MAG: hypothetical protein ACREYE_08875 [Gammaproteobacteria bacterium]